MAHRVAPGGFDGLLRFACDGPRRGKREFGQVRHTGIKENMKRRLKAILARWGYELVQLYEDEQRSLPPEVSFSYKEAQCYLAASAMGQISIAEARLLSDLVRSSDPSRPIVEIGTLFGFSTLVMVLAKQQGQRLITVDNYSWNPLGVRPDVHRALTRNRLADAVAEHHVTVLVMGAEEFYRSYQGPAPALFFCDADHSYEAVKKDLEWAIGANTSIICGDDYEPDTHPGVTLAVDELGGPAQLGGGLFVLANTRASGPVRSTVDAGTPR